MIFLLKNYLFLMALFLAGYGIARWGVGPELRRLMGPRYAAAYAITMFAGFFAPNVWIYHLVTVAAFLATTKDREDAICRYVAMIALIPGVSTIIVAGPVYLGTYSGNAVPSLAMLVASFVKRDRSRPAPRAPRGFRVEDAVVTALFLIFAFASARSLVPTVLIRNALINASDMVLPYYLIRRNVRSAEELRMVIGCIAFSAVSVALIAIYESRMSWPLYDAIVSHLSSVYGMAAATQQRGGSLRAMGAFGGPLGLAYFFVIALTAWLCSRQLFTKRLLWQGGIPVLMYALVAPQSRGALLMVVPTLLVLLVTRRRYAAAAAMLGVSGLVGAALYVLQHSNAAIGAFVGGARSGDYYDYRGLLLHRGLEEGMKHWVVGQSYLNVLASLVDITQGEHIVDLVNTYLTIFLYSGVVGLVPVVVFSLLTLRKLVARAPRGDTREAVRDARAFLLSVLVGTFVYLYGISFGERIVVYTVILFAMARLCSAQLLRTVPIAVPGRAGPRASEAEPEAVRLQPA